MNKTEQNQNCNVLLQSVISFHLVELLNTLCFTVYEYTFTNFLV